eukprot:6465369-Amphidinium_carterae.1
MNLVGEPVDCKWRGPAGIGNGLQASPRGCQRRWCNQNIQKGSCCTWDPAPNQPLEQSLRQNSSEIQELPSYTKDQSGDSTMSMSIGSALDWNASPKL